MRFILIFIFFFLLIGCSPEKEILFIPSDQYLIHTHNYYKDAEHFEYSAHYGLAQIGSLTLDCPKITNKIDSIECYHVIAKAELTGLAGGLTTLEDSWDSFIDTSSLLPKKFSRDLKENKYKKKEYTIFNRPSKQAIVHDTTGGVIKTKTFEITEKIQDMLSVYYLFRNVPFYELVEGDTLKMDVFLEQARYNIRIKYLGKEQIKTKYGKLSSFIIAPLIPENKMLQGEYPVKAWISDDERKIPLKVQVKILLGSVEVELEDYVSNKIANQK